MFKPQLRSAVFITLFLLGLSQHSIASEQPRIVSLKQAINTATQTVGGDVIKTETSEYNGKSVFIIRIVKEGRVKDVLIDSLSGEIVKPDME